MINVVSFLLHCNYQINREKKKIKKKKEEEEEKKKSWKTFVPKLIDSKVIGNWRKGDNNILKTHIILPSLSRKI